ncbi:MAG: DUF3857 domain-containing protein [Acidobacteria bacterium]|nr:DUF3857 domain-containing protein [Acidobacteriota bacterium]MBS1865804.1 DUF3857 domain-containing protein [Acidobacteriota bacterium]
MNQLFKRFSKCAILFCVMILFSSWAAFARTPQEKPKETPQEKPAETPPAKALEKTEEPPNAAQIELLETKYRFETNGDSRKEVHAVVKINSELGVRQFARLNFDYNRGFQSVEIPLARITHANGGTSDILPSAITDAPNPAVEKYPAYHDVRVKSVRILGLQPGDSLEYRVITTTIKPPLAPDFWLDHSFDRSGVASKQLLELDVPKSRKIQLHVNAMIPSAATTDSETEKDTRRVYTWNISQKFDTPAEASESDIVMTTFVSWDALAVALRKMLVPSKSTWSAVSEKASELAGNQPTPEKQVRAIYNFVSQKIPTVDLPLGATGFRIRALGEILTSGYANAEDKFALFLGMINGFEADAFPAFTGQAKEFSTSLPTPAVLSELLVIAGIPPKPSPGVGCGDCLTFVWLDPAVEVAPFRAIPASLRGREALSDISGGGRGGPSITRVPNDLPFPSTQNVGIAASLATDGTLKTKVKYALRGDNELLLRVTFHKAPTDKQREIAQYLSLSDGFRGKVTRVKTSDPYDTEEPFEVEYELTQEKFVDWAKKPVRIPALLPLPGLPDLTKKPAANSKIELGTPLEITLTGTLRLPPGTLATAPAGTSVKRDYATFTSTYSSKANVVNFSRHLNFLLPEIPSDRSLDLTAFIHAVQSDQSQLFVLDKPESVPPAKPK